MFHSLFPSLNDGDFVEHRRQVNPATLTTQELHSKLLFERKMQYINDAEYELTLTMNNTPSSSAVCLVQCDQNQVSEMMNFWEGRKMHQLNQNFLAFSNNNNFRNRFQNQNHKNMNNNNNSLSPDRNNNNNKSMNDMAATKEVVIYGDETNNVDDDNNNNNYGENNNNDDNPQRTPTRNSHHFIMNSNKFDPELYFTLRFSLGLQFALTSNRLNADGAGGCLFFKKSSNLDKDDYTTTRYAFQKGKFNNLNEFWNRDANSNEDHDNNDSSLPLSLNYNNNNTYFGSLLQSSAFSTRKNNINNNNEDLPPLSFPQTCYDQSEEALVDALLRRLRVVSTDHIPAAAYNTRLNNAPFKDLLLCPVVAVGENNNNSNHEENKIMPELTYAVAHNDESHIYRTVGDISRKVLELASRCPPALPTNNNNQNNKELIIPKTIEECVELNERVFNACQQQEDEEPEEFVASIVVDLAGVEGSQDKMQVLHLLNCLNIFAESRRRIMMWKPKEEVENNKNNDHLQFELVPRFPNVQCLVFVGDKVVNFSTNPCHQNQNQNQNNRNLVTSSIPPTFLDGLVSGILVLKSDQKAFYTNLSCLSFSPSFVFATDEKDSSGDGRNNNNESTPNKNQSMRNDPQQPSILGIELKISIDEENVVNVEAY